MKNYRHIPFEGMENARDLGGYATMDGGITRYGVYIRTELPEGLTAADWRLIREYNIVRSLDFRMSDENIAEPSDFTNAEGIEYIQVPMWDRNAAAGSKSEQEKRPAPPKDFIMPDWNITYIGMLDRHKEWAAKLMPLLLPENGGCVQFNCFTGKDRSGICAAMLLSIAGVSEEDICADYSLSMAYLGRRYDAVTERMHLPLDADGKPDLSRGFCATLPSFMRRTLAYVDQNYGSMIGYLRACGVTDETMNAIRARFVEY